VFKLDGLSGVLVALASPLKRDGAVDEAGVTRLVEHVLAHSVRLARRPRSTRQPGARSSAR